MAVKNVPSNWSISGPALQVLAASLNLKALPGSPLALALAQLDESGPVDTGESVTEARLTDAMAILAAPRRVVRVVTISPTQMSELYFFAGNAGMPYVGFWPADEQWQITYPINAEMICDIGVRCADLLGNAEMRAENLDMSPAAMLALAGCVDALRFRGLASALYRQEMPVSALTTKEIINQIGLGMSTGDPRWAVSVFAMAAPPETLPVSAEKIEIGHAVGELVAAGYLEANETVGFTPAGPLLRLTDTWSPPGPGVSYSVVDTDTRRAVTARESRLFLRGQGVLREIDWSAALTSDGRISLNKIAGEAAAKSVRKMLVRAQQTDVVRAPQADAAPRTCTVCRAPLAAGNKFCVSCGAEAPQSSVAMPTQGDTRICPSCQAQVSAMSRFCTACGAPMR